MATPADQVAKLESELAAQTLELETLESQAVSDPSGFDPHELLALRARRDATVAALGLAKDLDASAQRQAQADAAERLLDQVPGQVAQATEPVVEARDALVAAAARFAQVQEAAEAEVAVIRTAIAGVGDHPRVRRGGRTIAVDGTSVSTDRTGSLKAVARSLVPVFRNAGGLPVALDNFARTWS